MIRNPDTFLIKQLCDGVFPVGNSCHGMKELGALISKLKSVVRESFPPEEVLIAKQGKDPLWPLADQGKGSLCCNY
jgi:hypothetical protein